MKSPKKSLEKFGTRLLARFVSIMTCPLRPLYKPLGNRGVNDCNKKAAPFPKPLYLNPSP